MPEARTHNLLLALTVVVAALFCVPQTAPGKALDPSHFAQSDLWEPQPERVRVELVRVPGRQLVDFAIVTENASGRTKWLSRDPLGERGGLNLYGFVGNDPVNNWDYLGLDFKVDMSPVEIDGISSMKATITVKGVIIDSSTKPRVGEGRKKSFSPEVLNLYISHALKDMRGSFREADQKEFKLHGLQNEEWSVEGGLYEVIPDLRVVDSIDDAEPDDLIFNIVDDTLDALPAGGKAEGFGGRLFRISVNLFRDFRESSPLKQGDPNFHEKVEDWNNLRKIVNHETFHLAGLRHPKNALFESENNVFGGLDEDNTIESVPMDNVMRYFNQNIPELNGGIGLSLEQFFEIKRLIDAGELGKDMGLEKLGTPIENQLELMIGIKKRFDEINEKHRKK